jgi:Calcineurin-like phosphoesterase
MPRPSATSRAGDRVADVIPRWDDESVSSYDIIGDIHGCASQLKDLLDDMGYREDAAGVYRHPDRQAIFVGDLVDRGDGQLEVLSIVKRMVDGGTAQIVMGNHEFNAVAYATKRSDGSGEYLRRHTEKNNRQHQEFLDQVAGDTRAKYLDWFASIPLWLDLGDVRVVHACWHEPSMRVAEEVLGGNRFTSPEQFVAASAKGDPLYEAVEVLLKGPEISLAAHGQPRYFDKDGNSRDQARVAWWRDDATTLRGLAVMDGNFKTEGGQPYPDLPDIEVAASDLAYRYRGDVPVFYGHYWRRLEPEHARDWTSRTACVDFSAVKGGELVAYRFDGENEIDPSHYHRVGLHV